jgi:hypothetical protein
VITNLVRLLFLSNSMRQPEAGMQHELVFYLRLRFVEGS